ncbi:MAG TPA: 2-oxoglutarate dehydrogenase, E2 component, dihydrolipoamide succinyltransferase [Actinomycetota bacterium]|jgi:2-oxoglutarate dehydrogenase E2 component (dihydrolipoamide succinyltransferase)
MTAVKMPQLGETVIEGTILKWLKQEGDQVALDEPLFEISTDKVDTEVPSSAAGTLTKILVPEGETVAVGTELAEISEGGAGAAEAPGAASQPATTGSGGAETSSAPAGGDDAPSAAAPPAAPAAQPASAPPAAPAQTPAASPAAASAETVPSQMATSTQSALPDRGPRSQILSPLVRKLANEHGVDLSQVSGTGTGGRITKNDVLGFVSTQEAMAPVASAPEAAPVAQPAPAAPATAPATPPAPSTAPAVAQPAPAAMGGGEELVPVSHIRRTIAQHMKASLEISARAWNAVEINMENVARVRERTKDAFKAREGFGLTYMPFVTRAVTEALLAHPMVNSELRGDEIAVKHFVNMGIAVSYDEGLIVPVLKGSDTMNLLGIARGINDLATRARAKKLLPDEVHGGTFTITNPGPFGSLISVPIINQPQTGILGFDTVEKRPVVIDDTIAIRHMVYISMSWDHRVIDGALASQFLARVKQNLETWDFAEDLAL